MRTSLFQMAECRVNIEQNAYLIGGKRQVLPCRCRRKCSRFIPFAHLRCISAWRYLWLLEQRPRENPQRDDLLDLFRHLQTRSATSFTEQ